ncbi:MAG: hypothetical protein QY311_02485 [Candidatus Paceibacterota bacterium]|nr:MAG: hypothetical protein QY311_02485 [Candidatus Paceibacterota bacterium]
MSYKKKKQQKSIVNQLSYRVGLVKAALLKFWSQFNRKEKCVRLPQTQRVMETLRILNRGVRKNNKRVDGWVDEYVNSCALNGQPVEVLLQWCTALGLERRKAQQGGRFIPLPAERELIEKEMPRILNLFTQNSIEVTWFVTFNRSYVQERRLPAEPFREYMDMIRELAQDIPELSRVVFLDWEADVLGGEPKPSPAVLTNFDAFISKQALLVELQNFTRMLAAYPGKQATPEELKEEAKLRIACEAEEARFLTGGDSPFRKGEFILIPLEVPERYAFFRTLVPDFDKRIVSVVKQYPWRVS